MAFSKCTFSNCTVSALKGLVEAPFRVAQRRHFATNVAREVAYVVCNEARVLCLLRCTGRASWSLSLLRPRNEMVKWVNIYRLHKAFAESSSIN